MANLVAVNIDGKIIEVEPGTLIIEAAARLGIEIPTFCYDQRLVSVGACRMCLVEVEKSPKLIASCATPVAPGMVVKTGSEKVVKARQGVLEFLLINHPLDCPTCDKGGECPLQNLTLKYGPAVSRYTEDKIRFRDEPQQKFDDIKLGPEIWLNKNRCIICYKCVRIARDLAGGSDLGMFQRGAYAKIDIPAEVQYANEFSGNTVEYCPVGALMSGSFRYKIRTWLLTRTPSLSWLCPDGSNIMVEHNQGKIYRHSSRRNDNIDMGFLSDKDRYCFDITSHPDRLKNPLAESGGKLETIGYEEALARAVHRLSEEKGETSALLMDTTLTNEESFCISEYYDSQFPGARVAIASEINPGNDISACSLGLATSISELETADMVLIAGCDLGAEHPVIGLRVKKLIRKNVPVYFINNRRLNLGRFRVFNIEARSAEEADTLEKLTALCDGRGNDVLPSELGERIKRDFSSCRNIHILAGADFFGSADRSRYFDSLRKLSNRLNAQLSLLTTEANYLGVSLTGNVNSSLDDIIAGIEANRIKTVFVAGGDPVNIYPDRQRIISAFKKLEYLIYWGAFLNSTSELATLIFPAPLPTETRGSYINIERRLQFMNAPYPLTKGVTSLIRLLTDIKTEFGGELYYAPADVFSRITSSLPQFSRLKYESSEGYLFPYEPLNGNVSWRAGVADTSLAGYPYILNFARNAYYGGSGITSKSEVLAKLAPAQKLIINPGDALKEGFENGTMVRLEAVSGSGELPVAISDEVNGGELVLFGHSDINPPNKFMNGYNKRVYARLNKI